MLCAANIEKYLAKYFHPTKYGFFLEIHGCLSRYPSFYHEIKITLRIKQWFYFVFNLPLNTGSFNMTHA